MTDINYKECLRQLLIGLEFRNIEELLSEMEKRDEIEEGYKFLGEIYTKEVKGKIKKKD